MAKKLLCTLLLSILAKTALQTYKLLLLAGELHDATVIETQRSYQYPKFFDQSYKTSSIREHGSKEVDTHQLEPTEGILGIEKINRRPNLGTTLMNQFSIPMTNWLFLLSLKNYIYFYDGDSVLGQEKTHELSPNFYFKTSEEGVFFRTRDIPGPSLYLVYGSRYSPFRSIWNILDFSLPGGLITPESDFTYPTTMNYITWIHSTTKLFITSKLSSSQYAHKQDYITKAQELEFDTSGPSDGSWGIIRGQRYLRNNSFIATVTSDGLIRLYDWTGNNGGEPVKSFDLRNKYAMSITEFNNTELVFLTISDSNKMFGLNITTGDYLMEINYGNVEDSLYWFDFSYDYNYMVVHSEAHSVPVYQFNHSCYNDNCLNCLHAADRVCLTCVPEMVIHAGDCYNCSDFKTYYGHFEECLNEEGKRFYDWFLKQVEINRDFNRKRSEILEDSIYVVEINFEKVDRNFEEEFKSLDLTKIMEIKKETRDGSLNIVTTLDFKYKYLGGYRFRVEIKTENNFYGDILIFNWKDSQNNFFKNDQISIFGLQLKKGLVGISSMEGETEVVVEVSLFISRNTILGIIGSILMLVNLLMPCFSINLGVSIIKFFQITELCSKIYYIPGSFGRELDVFLMSLSRLEDVFSLDPYALARNRKASTYPYLGKLSGSFELPNLFNSIPVMIIVFLSLIVSKGFIEVVLFFRADEKNQDSVKKKKDYWRLFLKKINGSLKNLVDSTITDFIFYSCYSLIHSHGKVNFPVFASQAASCIVLTFVSLGIAKNGKRKGVESNSQLRLLETLSKVKTFTVMVCITTMQNLGPSSLFLSLAAQIINSIFVLIWFKNVMKRSGFFFALKEIFRELTLCLLLLFALVKYLLGTYWEQISPVGGYFETGLVVMIVLCIGVEFLYLVIKIIDFLRKGKKLQNNRYFDIKEGKGERVGNKMTKKLYPVPKGKVRA